LICKANVANEGIHVSVG